MNFNKILELVDIQEDVTMNFNKILELVDMHIV